MRILQITLKDSELKDKDVVMRSATKQQHSEPTLRTVWLHTPRATL